MIKRSYIILSLFLLWTIIFLTSCEAVGLPETGATPESENQQTEMVSPTPSPEEIVSTPTPKLTATPGVIDRSVAEISATTGLDRQVFLGLTGEDWVNLVISVLIFVIGTLILSWIVRFILGLIVRATPGKRDDEFFAAVRRHIDLLISLLVLTYATDRLAFIPVSGKETLDQIYFAAVIITIAGIFWKLLDLSFIWNQARVVPEGQVDHHASLRYLLRKILRALVVILAVTIVLRNYGVNTTFILAVLVGIAIALLIAGQDMLSDMIYGFILLFDQPFGVGDRIEIKELSTWGDVIEIGFRTTRVLTRDNRVVIYPNSIVGRSLLVNYSQPNVQFRTQIDIDVTYGEDLERVQAVIEDAIRSTEGLAPGQPIDVLLRGISKNGLKIRVRWWMANYADGRPGVDRVLRVVYTALLEAGIDMSLDTYDLNVFMEEEANMLSKKANHLEEEDE